MQSEKLYIIAYKMFLSNLVTSIFCYYCSSIGNFLKQWIDRQRQQQQTARITKPEVFEMFLSKSAAPRVPPSLLI